MGTSSARPEDLDTFVTGSRNADDVLVGYRSRLANDLQTFVQNSSWAHFDASSLTSGLAQFSDANQHDASWVGAVATAFRTAGGSGDIMNLPDAAIEASLRAVGLGGYDRASIVYSDPVAYGMPPTTGYANDPVSTALGNFVEVETDLAVTGQAAALTFARTYNSRSDRDGPFGPRWSSWATTRLTPTPDGVDYEGPDGQRASFPREGSGFGRVAGVNALVERTADGYAMDWFGGRRWRFDAAGRPVAVDAGPGTTVTLTWNDAGRLAALAHERGQRVELVWEGERVTGLNASDGRLVTYRYDDAGRLVEADTAAGTRTYTIDDAGLIGAVTDADGVVELQNRYDEHGRVVEQLSPFGRRTSFHYLPGGVTVTSDDSGGPMNTFVHDNAGRLIAAIDGHEQTFRRQYDEWGNPVVVVERDGAATVQEWDERSRLVRRTLPSGAWVELTWDDADRVRTTTVSTGAVTTFDYDGGERVPARIVDPEGGVTRLRVVDGLMLEVVDADGVTVALRYDDAGDLVEIVDADGVSGRIERGPGGRIDAAVSPAGRRTEFGYDARGLVVSRTEPDSAVWRFEHSSSGRPTATVDPLGARTERRWGRHGELEEVVDALGARTQRQYDVLGNLTGFLEADGSKWSYAYDALCRLSAATNPAGATWLREYDAAGHLVGTIGPTGIRRTITVDPALGVTGVADGLTSASVQRDELGRALAVVRADGTAVRSSYDLCGRVVATTAPDGGTVRREYTPAGRLRRVVSAAGRQQLNEYDRCGRLAATVDGTGARWAVRCDADGLPVARVAPTGETEELERDAAGRVVVRNLPGRGATTFTYDAVGRLVAVTDATGGRRGFTRDALGRVVAATDANGAVTAYEHDERGRLVRITDPLGATTIRMHDEVGRVVAETDPLGRTTTWSYDAAGRLLQRTDPAGARLHWSYDESGRLRDIRGAGAAETVWIERDTVGRPTAWVEPGRARVEQRYDVCDRLVERRRGELALTWTYDADGAVTGVGFPDGSALRRDRDGAGRVVAVEHPLLGRVTLQRDPAGRLVAAGAAGLDAAWTYRDGAPHTHTARRGGIAATTTLDRDVAGRVVAVTTGGRTRRFIHDPAGQLTGVEGTDGQQRFVYDAAGRLVEDTGRSFAYDAAGQLVEAGERNVSYDAVGRRVEESDSDTTRVYGWDWLGRPTGVRTETAGQTTDTRWLVDATGELAEIDGRPLLWDTADPFAPLAWLDGSPVLHAGPQQAVPGLGDPWLDVDVFGSVGAGSDPWGAAAASPAPGFRGELAIDGLVWLRHRVYDPATRGFLSRDPLPAVAGTAVAGNPYHYASNDPVDFVDPLGLRPMTEADFAAWRNNMSSGIVGATENWAKNNWEYVAGGAMIIAGGALLVFTSETGVGAVAGSALLNAGLTTVKDKVTNGKVDWNEVIDAGVVGGVTGYLGAGAALSDSLVETSAVKSLGSVGSKAVADGAGNLVDGVIGRTMQNPTDPGKIFDPTDMVLDGVSGGAIGGFKGLRTPDIPSNTQQTLFDPTPYETGSVQQQFDFGPMSGGAPSPAPSVPGVPQISPNQLSFFGGTQLSLPLSIP